MKSQQNRIELVTRPGGDYYYFHSNGLLDPWSSGGILRDVNKSVVSLLIPLGAHHFDLRGNTANDPREIRDARNLEAQRIQQWIKEARQRQKKEKKVFQNSGPSGTLTDAICFSFAFSHIS